MYMLALASRRCSPPHYKVMNNELCTHCEVNGDHEADLTTSSDVVHKTECGDGSAGNTSMCAKQVIARHQKK